MHLQLLLSGIKHLYNILPIRLRPIIRPIHNYDKGKIPFISFFRLFQHKMQVLDIIQGEYEWIIQAWFLPHGQCIVDLVEKGAFLESFKATVSESDLTEEMVVLKALSEERLIHTII